MNNLDHELEKFLKTERTWEEIITNFKEHSLNAIAFALRELEAEKRIKVNVKYHSAP